MNPTDKLPPLIAVLERINDGAYLFPGYDVRTVKAILNECLAPAAPSEPVAKRRTLSWQLRIINAASDVMDAYQARFADNAGRLVGPVDPEMEALGKALSAGTEPAMREREELAPSQAGEPVAKAVRDAKEMMLRGEIHAALGKLHEVERALAATPQPSAKPAGAGESCQYCDDTGDVHSISGEWRGQCHCPAGTATTSAATAGLSDAATPRDLIEALVACHEEPTCPAVTMAREYLASTPAPVKAVVTDEMVSRFLAWSLPKDFCPDGGINFDGRGRPAFGYEKSWPTGTNLLTAAQAREMLKHVLQVAPPAAQGAPVMAVVTGAEAPHTDDIAVDEFAWAMKKKLAVARRKGRSGWESCDPAVLVRMLREHVEKGDPCDVANFCMFLWHLDAGTSNPPAEPVAGWCPACNGSGESKAMTRHLGPDDYYEECVCPVCKGSGDAAPSLATPPAAQGAPVIAEASFTVPEGFVLMPKVLTDGQLTMAQGELLDPDWDAVTCFAARVQRLYDITRPAVEAATRKGQAE